MALLGEKPTQFEADVAERLYLLKVQEEAKRLLAAEQSGESPIPEIHSLATLLDRTWPEEQELIESLWPKDGRTVLAAGAKVGKTTLVGNVIRSLVDGEPLLGAYKTMPLTGKVVLLNFELSPQKMTEWLRDIGIKNTEKLIVINLRGQSSAFDIREPKRRAEWAKLLRDVDSQVVIWDCLTPVLNAFGLDEKTEIRKLLYPFDELLVEGCATEALVVHHMGYVAGRPRGDSAIIGWPDALWFYEKHDKEKVTTNENGMRVVTSEVRQLWAEGRDVAVDRTPLAYDHKTRRLSIMDMGAKRSREDEIKTEKILDFIKRYPNEYSRRELGMEQFGEFELSQAEARRLIQTEYFESRIVATKLGRRDVLSVRDGCHE